VRAAWWAPGIQPGSTHHTLYEGSNNIYFTLENELKDQGRRNEGGNRWYWQRQKT